MANKKLCRYYMRQGQRLCLNHRCRSVLPVLVDLQDLQCRHHKLSYTKQSNDVHMWLSVQHRVEID